MKSMLHLLFVSLFLLGSCAHRERTRLPETKLQSSVEKYFLLDKSGQFKIDRKVDMKLSEKKIMTHFSILNNKSETIEKSITISQIVKNNKGMRILRPEISQYTVWLENKKYLSQIEFDWNKKTIKEVTKDGNGPEVKKSFPIKISDEIYCFYSQLVECVNTFGFFEAATEEKVGSLNVNIIWDGHPYFFEQYTGFSGNIVSKGQLSFDGEVENAFRFNLEVENQILFYIINKKFGLDKIFWVGQGLTISKNASDSDIRNLEAE
jgi:hypothetical protein